MQVFDVFEAWLSSMRTCISESGAVADFARSPIDRPNPSCSLNIRQNEREMDLLVWESGEAEISVGSMDGAIKQIHFDNVRDKEELSALLCEMVGFVIHNEVE